MRTTTRPVGCMLQLMAHLHGSVNKSELQAKRRSNALLTYLFTPWCRVLLEKLTGLQLVKKFPAFHGTRRFITAKTCVLHPACECFLTKCFTGRGCLHLAQPPSWRTTPRRLSATDYSIYSQLPSISEAVPLSAT